MNKIKPESTNVSKKLILFILASVIFWLMTKLSKEYEKTIDFPIVYEQLPKNKLFKDNPISQISIQVKSSGFKLISSYLFPKKLAINVADLSQKESKEYYVLLSRQKQEIQKQLTSGFDIDYFKNDTLFLNLGSLQTKKVPVNFDSNMTFATGFGIEGNITIVPDSVEVIGVSSVLDTIFAVNTEKYTATKVNEDLSQELDLQFSLSQKNIRLSTNTVKITAKVSKFTEGSLELPFTIVNLPDGVSVRTFPQKVTATYTVALDNFNNVNADLFKVVCDYSLVSDGINYLTPKLVTSSDLVKNVKISPNRIDFIFEKL